jgi:hypothetical protein
MDWKMRNLHFESVNKITPKYKTFPTCALDSKHDFTHENIIKNSQHMQEFKCEGDITGNQGSKQFKPLFMGAKTFIQATKKGDALFLYATLTLDLGMQQHKMFIQYQDYKDVFEKKNANTLPKHWPYDCAIDLEKGMQPPFEPIYNLSQEELSTLRKYIDENLEKRFI